MEPHTPPRTRPPRPRLRGRTYRLRSTVAPTLPPRGGRRRRWTKDGGKCARQDSFDFLAPERGVAATKTRLFNLPCCMIARSIRKGLRPPRTNRGLSKQSPQLVIEEVLRQGT